MMPIVLVNFEKKEILEFIRKDLGSDFILFEINNDKKKVSINDIREIVKETSTCQNKPRVYLFYNFYLASNEAQNAFLKTLEEPPPKTLFILSVDNQEKILPTILSRSRIIINKRNFKLSEEIKEILKKFAENEILDLRLSEKISVGEVISFLKEKLKEEKNILPILKEALEINNLIEKNNLNKILALDYLLIQIKRLFQKKEITRAFS